MGRDDAARDHIDKVQRHQARCGHLLGPGADAAQVMGIAQCHDATALGLGAGYAQCHGLLADHLAKALLAVQAQHGPGVQQHADLCVGPQAPLQVGVGIARQHADAVRVMPGQVGLDQVIHHGGHLGVTAAKAAHQQAHGRQQGWQGDQVHVAHGRPLAVC